MNLSCNFLLKARKRLVKAYYIQRTLCIFLCFSRSAKLIFSPYYLALNNLSSGNSNILDNKTRLYQKGKISFYIFTQLQCPLELSLYGQYNLSDTINHRQNYLMNLILLDVLGLQKLTSSILHVKHLQNIIVIVVNGLNWAIVTVENKTKSCVTKMSHTQYFPYISVRASFWVLCCTIKRRLSLVMSPPR